MAGKGRLYDGDFVLASESRLFERRSEDSGRRTGACACLATGGHIADLRALPKQTQVQVRFLLNSRFSATSSLIRHKIFGVTCKGVSGPSLLLLLPNNVTQTLCPRIVSKMCSKQALSKPQASQAPDTFFPSAAYFSVRISVSRPSNRCESCPSSNAVAPRRLPLCHVNAMITTSPHSLFRCRTHSIPTIDSSRRPPLHTVHFIGIAPCTGTVLRRPSVDHCFNSESSPSIISAVCLPLPGYFWEKIDIRSTTTHRTSIAGRPVLFPPMLGKHPSRAHPR
ncbi:hypothetical protein HYPSUDRAFT_914316 [Hypholoma sublateritium FD-334 SS-4]|uniref:Uncharacterized protein n=1 Tax=Hypholoma sublateritium (strain FD-334 SS-4) TaxID=945553 RepID=A0A0D2KVZ1_HYPSF|nr:hypothetical protein HYPSUDRAFT_914316 [Hypholoma sublateritium FD-334 SS-4]